MRTEQSVSPTKMSGAEKVRRYRCPGCGADLIFEPRDGCLVCPYCGRRESIAGGGRVEERSYEEYLRLYEGQLTTLAEGALEVRCDACGASVVFAPPQVAGECDFCGGKIVAQPVAADPIVAPGGVLPFAVTRESATEAVRGWIAGLWFAPNALKRLAQQEELGGVYLPFWTYDAHTTSTYTGQRGEYYWVTESYTVTDAQGRPETRTRQVRHTRWHAAEGTVSRWFDDLLVPATRSLAPQRLAALEPWDLAALSAYEPAYLSGFKAQRYQVGFEEGFELAKQLAASVIEGDVRGDIGGDEQRIENLNVHYSAVTFKHLLLPVYVGAYRFGERVFQVTVNGRTGEVQGERPYSAWKIFFLVATVAALIALAVIVFGGER